jgi:hypothetical protein
MERVERFGNLSGRSWSERSSYLPGDFEDGSGSKGRKLSNFSDTAFVRHLRIAEIIGREEADHFRIINPSMACVAEQKDILFGRAFSQRQRRLASR